MAGRGNIYDAAAAVKVWRIAKGSKLTLAADAATSYTVTEPGVLAIGVVHEETTLENIRVAPIGTTATAANSMAIPDNQVVYISAKDGEVISFYNDSASGVDLSVVELR